MIVPVKASIGRIPKIPNGRHLVAGGGVIYIRDGQKHRENGPAETMRGGYEAWFFKGKKHRKGGLPAVTHPDGSKEYWEEGKFIRMEKSRNG